MWHDTLRSLVDPQPGTGASARRPLILVLSGLLLAVSLVMSYADTTGDTDIWWHLKYGEQVVENATWHQDHDAWSWTPMTGDWTYVTWLSDAVFYGAYRAVGGPLGPYLVQWALYLLVIGLYLSLVRRRTGGVDAVDFAVVVVAFLAMRSVATLVKPENFTVFFFALTTWLYVDARLRGRDRFWLLPIVFWAWANAHGGFLAGFLLLGALAVGETVGRGTGVGLPRRSYVRLLGFGAAALAATCVNPEGFALLTDPLRVMLTSGGADDATRVVAHAPRWTQLVPGSLFEAYRSIATWLLVAVFGLQATLLFRRFRRGDGLDAAVLIGAAGFFLMAVLVNRASIFASLFFLMTFVLVTRTRTTEETLESWVPRTPGGSLAGLAVAATIAVVLHSTFAAPLHWGGSSSAHQLPVEASRFVREADLPGPLFNDYAIGGYLVWDLAPERAVFIDPRYRPYRAAFREQYIGLIRNPSPEGFASLASEYGFNTAVVDHRAHPGSSRALDATPGWTLVFVGPAASVFVRSALVTAEVAAAIPENTDPRRLVWTRNPDVLGAAANVVMPRDPGVVADIAFAVREHVPWYQARRVRLLDAFDGLLRQMGGTAPDGHRLTAQEMGDRFLYHYREGDLESARIVAAAYLIDHPDDPQMWFNRACVESAVGHTEVAAVSLDRALAAGFDRADLVRTTPDLAALRATDTFAEIARRHGIEAPAAAR